MSDGYTEFTEDVPANALRFTSTFELGDNGDDAKTAPFRMVARTGDAIEHPFWGRIAHDLSGMRLAGSRVSIDYEHDTREILGYANHFDADSGHLEVAGTLVPTQFNNRATEIIQLSKAGVPYEASINFSGPGIKLQRLEDNEVSEVNGQTLTGPAVVVREWPLRSIAITPSGADPGTSTTFAEGADFVPVNIFKRGQEMEETKLTEAVVDEVEAVDVVDDSTEVEPVTEPVEAVEVSPEEAQEEEVVLSDRATEGKRFIDAFGELQGALYFAQGADFEEAQTKELKRLREENVELAKKLSAQAADGEAEPLEFSDTTKPERAMHIVPRKQ